MAARLTLSPTELANVSMLWSERDRRRGPAARAVPDRALLTDAQWARLAPLLPPQQPKTGSRGGGPNKDDRLVVEGMLWILRTGAPWRDLPKDYGPHSTVANRFYRWWRAGILERVFAASNEARQLGW